MKLSLRRSLSLAAACAAPLLLHAQENRTPWIREPAEIRRTLDSLAAVSVGSYVHFAIGSCAGGRCEARVSLHRTEEDEPYRYRAAAWVGMPAKPRFYGATMELEEERAGMVLADARLAGVLGLVPDSAAGDARQPRFWLRARFGDRTVVIDGASLGSPSYAASVDGGPGALYEKVERALLAPLRQRYADQ